MTIHQPPVPAGTPLRIWGSTEIADFFRRAPRSGPLPEPGMNAMRLLIEPRPVTFETPPDARQDWTGTVPCNHRRDAGLPNYAPPVRPHDLSANELRIIRILAALDTRLMPRGQPVRMCVNRARLKASAETMRALHHRRLVNGAGSRDAWGTGNTAASSWWWLSTDGLALAYEIGALDAVDF